MSITIDWGTRVISVPKADMALIQSSPIEVRELDLDMFRLALKDLEDDPEGMNEVDTHGHNLPVSVGGITLARVVEIINGYTVTFEDGAYVVNLVGANSNVADRVNPNNVSIRSANSAGLQVVVSGSGVTAQDKTDIIDGTWAKTLEGMTAEQMMRVMLAALAGKRQGLGTATEQYMAQDEVTPRITLTPDANGNGTPVVDGS